MKNLQRGLMSVRNAFVSVVAATTAVVALAACAPPKVNRDVLLNVKKVGILSVTIDKIGTQSTDDEVMQATVNYAAGLYADALSKRPEWRLVPLSVYRDNPHFRDFLRPLAKPQKQAEEPKKEESGFLSALSKLAKQFATPEPIEATVKRYSTPYLAASDMPIIPYVLIESGGSTSSTTGGQQNVSPRDELFAKTGALAGKLDLDGLIIVYLNTGIRHTVGVGVTLGERGNDTIRMEPTMILVARNGKAAINMGAPSIDALSPSNASVPLYRASGHRGGTFSFGTQRPDQIIDLKDPKGEVQKDFYELTDDALKYFMKKLDKELATK